MINSLVLAFYFLQWKPSSNSVVYDEIQISIALTNVFLQGFMSVDGVLHTLFNLGKDISLLLITLQIGLSYTSVWNTAWLSVFFYVRLVNISHPYLLRMKAMFLSCVPQLMVGSVLGSVINSLPSFWLTEIIITQNRTLIVYDITVDFSHTMISSFFGCLVPIAVTCLCIGQCVTSLLRHVWRMNLSESHLTSSQLQGHIRAAGIMIMRLLLDLTLFVLAMVSLLTSFRMHYITEKQNL
ncbi:taste receptor type 2 member 40-like [Mantella aurantiaca]